MERPLHTYSLQHLPTNGIFISLHTPSLGPIISISHRTMRGHPRPDPTSHNVLSHLSATTANHARNQPVIRLMYNIIHARQSYYTCMYRLPPSLGAAARPHSLPAPHTTAEASEGLTYVTNTS